MGWSDSTQSNYGEFSYGHLWKQKSNCTIEYCRKIRIGYTEQRKFGDYMHQYSYYYSLDMYIFTGIYNIYHGVNDEELSTS